MPRPPRPRPRPRLNAALRWGGAAAALAILALLVVSRWSALTIHASFSHSRAFAASLASGCLILESTGIGYADEAPAPPGPAGPAFNITRHSCWTKSLEPYLDLWFSRGERTLHSMADGPTATLRDFAIPLWSIALIPATLSALAWRRRPRATTACPCGYDRAGLPPGAPCPECAAAAP